MRKVNLKNIKLWDFHWRLRDELIHREDKKIKGGYHNKKDDIRNMDISLIKLLDKLLTDYRLKTEGNADT